MQLRWDWQPVVQPAPGIVARVANGYAGEPLPAAEAPGTTASATGLPIPSSEPSSSPQPTPAGGISKAEAFRIAVGVLHPPSSQVKGVSPGASFDSGYGRWVWNVSFGVSCGNICGYGTWVAIDFFTGDIVAQGEWIS